MCLRPCRFNFTKYINVLLDSGTMGRADMSAIKIDTKFVFQLPAGNLEQSMHGG
jgi:hypothetical protein